MKNKYFILFIVIVLVFKVGNAQVKTKTFPDAIPAEMTPMKELFKKEYKIAASAEFVKQKLQKAQDDNSGKKPKNILDKFALPTSVDIDVLKEASIIENNGVYIYLLRLKAEDALNLSVQFKEFVLSENALLSIYSKNELTDSITSNENNERKMWGTRVYQGNILDIVLRVPSSEKGISTLKIGNVYFGYKNIGDGRFGNPGSSGACNINVACPLGVGWEPERNSVAIVQAVGGLCSGVMVMNTCGSNVPYFLTAKHNVDQGGNVANWVFQFFYFSTVCNTNTGFREDVQFNGSVVRAMEANSDFALLQLNQTPPANSGIHYAGWNRGNFPPNVGTGIHHPNGDVMKISRTNQIIRSGGGIYPFFAHWQVNWNQGITAVGSSGSPLFDGAHRVVGQLHDGQSFCNTPNAPDWYGSFDVSWTGAGTNATRLSNWLDPGNTGAGSMNTTNVASLTPAITTINGPAVFCASQAYTTNLPTGTNITWSVTPAGIVSLSQSGNTATLTKITNGVITLSASLCGANPVIKNITVGTPQPQYINVSNGPCPEYTVSTNSIPCTGPCSSYTWSFYNQTTGAPTQTFPNSANVRRLILNQGSGTYNFSVKLTNSCGTSATQSTTRAITCNFGMLTVSPNPASESIVVESSENNKFTRLRIIDKVGQIRKEIATAPSQRLSVDISNLSTDIYRIQALFEGKWETVSFIKQ